jgi:16S rRNA (guanine(966)-N(2))-methyltransferase RsmD
VEKTELRIVAGSLRGRKISAVVHPALRPTPQMVREALFSILGNAVPDRLFLDLFSGTGIVGLEAVSRGAKHAWLIERDPRQVLAIERYAEQFDVRDRVTVLRADVYRWIERWLPPAEPVTAFFSPPFPDLDTAKRPAFLAAVNDLWSKLPDDSVLCIQAEDGFPVEELSDHADWDVRKYGRNLLLFRVRDLTAVEPVPLSAEPE